MVRHRLVLAGVVCALPAAICPRSEATLVEFGFTMWNGDGESWRGVEIEIVRPPISVPLSNRDFAATHFVVDPPSLDNAVLGDAGATFLMVPGYDGKLLQIFFSNGFGVALGDTVRFSAMVDLPACASVAFRRTPIMVPGPGVGVLAGMGLGAAGLRRRRRFGQAG